ncbi:MAG: VWA domain-containing protein [Deltaproteobacteria bacterium]|nr:VWA domain-containing protein [Deltaproteobacteria bacterium]
MTARLRCITLLLALASCGEGIRAFPSGQISTTLDGGAIDAFVPPDFGVVETPRALDVLFVIDNSWSMAQEQINLRRNFGRLIDALRHSAYGSTVDGSGMPCDPYDNRGCSLPDIQIGVISTDIGAGRYTNVEGCYRVGGDQGKLQRGTSCAGLLLDSGFIAIKGGVPNLPIAAHSNAIDAVKDAFACVATLGTAGCGFEQPLAAMKMALSPLNNPGFVRDGAALAIIFITDEDDCSAKDTAIFDPDQALFNALGPVTSFRCFEYGVRCNTTGRDTFGQRYNCRSVAPNTTPLYGVQEFVDFLRTLKPQQHIVIGTIAGPSEPVNVVPDDGMASLAPACSTRQTDARPAIRLKVFTDAFAPNAVFSTICTDDFGPAMGLIAHRIRDVLGLL